MSRKTQDNDVTGDFEFPLEWTVFGPAGKDDPEPDFAGMKAIPRNLAIAGKRLAGLKATFAENRLDLGTLLGGKDAGRTAYVMAIVETDTAMEVQFGTGAGWFMKWWVNGEVVCDTMASGNGVHPPTPFDHRITARLKGGRNLLVVKVSCFYDTFLLAAAGSAEVRADAQQQRVWRRTIAYMTDRRDVVPAGEIVYVNPDPPDVPLRPYAGERYRDRVPDTYDVAERAALCINALTGATNPLADHEQYFWVLFFRNPVVMRANIDDLCQAKFMEALPLLRIASGSRTRLEVDETWHRVTLQSIGPDGLFYLPLSGRPWGRGGGCAPKGFPVACADGRVRGTMDPAVTQFSHPFLNERQLNAQIVQHLRDGHPFWAEAMRKCLACMAELLVFRDDFCHIQDIGYEPGTPWRPDATGQLPPGFHAEFPNTGTDMNVTYTTANLVFCAAKYYRLTGDARAGTIAKKAARYVMRHGRYFGPAGEFEGDKHFHAHTGSLAGLLEYAMAVDDRETLEFVRQSYEWAKSPAAGSSDTLGFFPEHARPDYRMCESCEIADMIGLALKLSKAGVGDYYNDAERWIRNHFAESQLMDYQALEQLAARQPAQQVGENETAWHVAERNVGAFAGWSTASDFSITLGIMHCCTGNAARALYWIWQEALRCQDGELCVNLLLNRASREADVYSFIPYQGKVEIMVKEAGANVRVHAPGWVETGSPEMRATVDDKGLKTRWEGRYVVLGPARPGQRITVSFPLPERTVKETIGLVEYTLVIRGDTVVHIDPPGRNLPIMYRRDHYRSGEPRYIEVERFLSDTTVEY